jgi:hypothetical protein
VIVEKCEVGISYNFPLWFRTLPKNAHPTHKDIDNAVVKSRQAKKWDNGLDFDPQGKAEELAK